MAQETKDHRIGDAVATIGIRDNKSMWVSVLWHGRHYQCDFIGDFDRGPQSIYDFKYEPPSWLVEIMKKEGA